MKKIWIILSGFILTISLSFVGHNFSVQDQNKTVNILDNLPEGSILIAPGKQCTSDLSCPLMEECYKSAPHKIYGTCVEKY